MVLKFYYLDIFLSPKRQQMNFMRQSIPLFFCLLLIGCNPQEQFEIVRAGSQTLVLNKSSGDVQVIDGVSLIKVKVPESGSTDFVSKQAKSWPVQEIPQLGNLKLVMRTKFRDGRMMYSVEATPFQGKLEKEYLGGGSDYLRQPTIYIDLYDEDGFATSQPIDLKIRGGGATRVVNEKGESYALSWAGSVPMSLDAYRASINQSVRWAAFSKE